MAVPDLNTALKAAAVVVGGLFGLIVVLPLVPLVLEIVVGTVRGFLDVVVPGGRTFE